jgi:hypothetical protein
MGFDMNRSKAGWPKVILKRLAKLEAEIEKGRKELEGLLG